MVNPKEGSWLSRFRSWVLNNQEMKYLRTHFHYAFLLGVSIAVAMSMESHLTKLREKVKSSVSLREYEQQKAYQNIVKNLKEYDPEGVPLERPPEENPVYKYMYREEDTDE